MIKELINFTKNLDEGIKGFAFKPSKGLHVTLKRDEDNKYIVDRWKLYDEKEELDDFLLQALLYERYSTYIDMNKQQKFDPKQKVHSASPFSFAFNFSLGNNKKEIEDDLKKQLDDKSNKSELDRLSKEFKLKEVIKSTDTYFSNAQKLCLKNIDADEKVKIELFQAFCKNDLVPFLQEIKADSDPILPSFKEKDYIRIYLGDVKEETWKEAYEYYFNNVYPPSELQESDFITTYSDKKPFLTHQTATFDVSSKLSGSELKVLNEFKELLSVKNPRIIPNPLPIFIFKEELQKKSIGIFNEDRSIKFSELCKKLILDYKDEFGNYYLLNWSKGKDIRVNDLDFVSKFEFEFKAQIHNLFELIEKDSKTPIHYPFISNVFEFEQVVFYSLIQCKYKKVDYFTDLKDLKDNYTDLPNTFISLTKYRKAIYDFVYKSKKQGIDSNVFYDLVFNHIRDDIKNDRGYSIKEKLNIWFSLYEQFTQNNTNEKTMASNLKGYREFVEKITKDEVDFDTATDEQFMFVAGQVIDYLMSKSKSADTSYQLLEPYTQKSNCKELQKAIANDFARYKHATYSGNFEKAASFVLTYETKANLKSYLPELLAGVFSKNQLFPTKKESTTI